MPNQSKKRPDAAKLSLRNCLAPDRFEHLVQSQRSLLAESRERKEPAAPRVQMSIRIQEAEYLKFRALCVATRSTNGAMLSELIKIYLANPTD